MNKLVADFDECNLVFVYGSLKSGNWNNRLLSSSTLIGDDTTVGQYVLGDVGFPYAFPREVVEHLFENDDLYRPVLGELWEMADVDTLRRLDGLEGHPSHYYRTLIELQSGQHAWTYHQLDADCIYRCYACDKTQNGEWQWLSTM